MDVQVQRAQDVQELPDEAELRKELRVLGVKEKSVKCSCFSSSF